MSLVSCRRLREVSDEHISPALYILNIASIVKVTGWFKLGFKYVLIAFVDIFMS